MECLDCYANGYRVCELLSFCLNSQANIWFESFYVLGGELTMCSRILLFFSIDAFSTTTNYDLSQEYLEARNIRTSQGHAADILIYCSLLKQNPNDCTAASRIAAAKSSLLRQDNTFSNSNSHDITSLQQLLQDCHFTHDYLQQFLGIQGDNKFASGPVYMKPVMAGAVLGLAPPLQQLQFNDDNDDAGFRCLLSFFLLGFAGNN